MAGEDARRSMCAALRFRLRIAQQNELLCDMNYVAEVEVECPYCGEAFATTVDTSQGNMSTIEDCAVCCRPIALRFECEPGEVIAVETSRA